MFGLYFNINPGKSFASNFGIRIVSNPNDNGICVAPHIPYATNGGKKFKNKSDFLKLYSPSICWLAISFKFLFDNTTVFGFPVVPPVFTITAAFSSLFFEIDGTSTFACLMKSSQVNTLYFLYLNL